MYKWISIKEQLPKEHSLVIAISGKVLSYIIVSKFYHNHFWSVNDTLLGPDITHWIPFPEYPNE